MCRRNRKRPLGCQDRCKHRTRQLAITRNDNFAVHEVPRLLDLVGTHAKREDLIVECA